MKQPLVVIAGPTACGKTKTAIELAKKINGEIVSADSMQVYKYMDIGTAKPTIEEMQGIRHYLIDELYPDQEFNVAVFTKMAKGYIDEIYNKGKTPIIAGGTGFYIQALIKGNNFSEEQNDFSYRNELLQMAESKGNAFVYDILRQTDPEAAEKIHENNIKRVIRALEFYKLTGTRISEHNKAEAERGYAYNVFFAILNCDREKLYNRIELRIDKMISDGLVQEVENLLNLGYGESLVSMQGLGYKELVPYVKGHIPLETAIYNLKQNTRHFAKRQLTWFKNKCDGIWFRVDENDISCIIEGKLQDSKLNLT